MRGMQRYAVPFLAYSNNNEQQSSLEGFRPESQAFISLENGITGE